jgi:glycerophosphoryl diester phosphodiesterase
MTPCLVIAHRGASAYEVENSLAAFRLARDQGADGVELDVHVSADGVPVVHHDPHVDSLAIAASPHRELRELRLPNDEALPTLSEALDVLGKDLNAYVEVKDLPPEHDAAILEALERGPAPTRYQVHSFDHRIVWRLRAQRPALPTGVLVVAHAVRPLVLLEDAGASVLWQQEGLIDEPLVAAAHERGYRVIAWTVDDPARMRLLIEAGVDGICTNRPDVARRVVG